MLPGALLGIGAAWALAAHISDAAVRVFIGVITIAFVLYNWIGPTRVAREAGRPSVAGGVFWGALSGFTSTHLPGRRAALPDVRAGAAADRR